MVSVARDGIWSQQKRCIPDFTDMGYNVLDIPTGLPRVSPKASQPVFILGSRREEPVKKKVEDAEKLIRKIR